MAKEKELYSIGSAADALASDVGRLQNAMETLSKSKGWTAFGRMVSGVLPGLWSFQNKIRGITDIFTMYYKGLDKSKKQAIEMLNATVKLNKALEKFPEDIFAHDLDALGQTGSIGGVANAKQVDKLYKSMKKQMGDFGAIERRVMGTGDAAKGKAKQLEVLKEIEFMLGDQYEELVKANDIAHQEYTDRRDGVTKRQKFMRWFDKIKAAVALWYAGLTKNKIIDFTKKVFMKLLKFFGIISGISVLIFFIWRTYKSASKYFEGLGAAIKFFLEQMWAGLSAVAKGVSDIIYGIQHNELETVLLGAVQIVGGLLVAAGSAILTILTVVIGGLLGLILGGIVDWFADSERNWKTGLSSVLTAIGWLALIAAGLSWLGFKLTFLGAAITMWPALIAGAIALALASYIGKAATGGMRSGLTVVGERGPELVNLPKGSRVYSNQESKNMSGGNTINVHVNGRVGASDAEIRDIADKVGREINLRMNRTTSTQVRF